MSKLQGIYYQPNDMKGQIAIRKLKDLGKEKPKVIKQWLYMPLDKLYGNKYQYILPGIAVASRYKVTRPLRTKQAKDVADMIADIYKVGPLTFPKIFQCSNEFKVEVTKMLEKHEVTIRHMTTKYKHIC